MNFCSPASTSPVLGSWVCATTSISVVLGIKARSSGVPHVHPKPSSSLSPHTTLLHHEVSIPYFSPNHLKWKHPSLLASVLYKESGRWNCALGHSFSNSKGIRLDSENLFQRQPAPLMLSPNRSARCLENSFTFADSRSSHII